MSPVRQLAVDASTSAGRAGPIQTASFPGSPEIGAAGIPHMDHARQPPMLRRHRDAMRWIAFLVVHLVVLTAVPLVVASQDDWFVPLGPPPKATPKRINGGEGFAPLPLPGPVTPLRRSERKRQPSPPTRVGKVVWGESASFTFKQGGETQIADLSTAPECTAI
jgi:hypothetical protein